MTFPIKQTVRALRRKQTYAERLLWKELRNRKVEGHRFVRQFPIPYIFEGQSRLFIADFYCAQSRLVIELDGDSHQDKKEHDQFRDLVMEAHNLTVLRFTNDQAIYHMSELIASLKKSLL